MHSNYFNSAALKGLNRIGDVFIPQSGDLPAFSDFGGAEHVDKVIAYAPPGDIASLNMVLSLFSFLPEGMLRWAAGQMVAASHRDGSLDVLLRQLHIGLKGILFSCYYSGRGGSDYSGKNPLEVIKYQPNRVED